MSTRKFNGTTYSNGRAPSSILAPLEPRGRHGNSGTAEAYLRSDAAASWNRAIKEVKRKTGIDLRVRGWNRSRAEQDRFWNQRMTTSYISGRPRIFWNGRWWYRRPGYAAVAPPGTSNHGWGTTVDVIDFGGVGQWNHPRRVKAMPILKKHGWTDDEGRQAHVQEPWHIEYVPSKDRAKGSGGGSSSKPKTKEEWFDMAKYKRTSTTKSQNIPKGKWKTLKINGKGHVSLLKGPKDLWDALLRLKLSGVPKGQEVQVRFIAVSYGGGKKTRIRTTYPTVEIIGTEGATLGQVAMRAKLPGNRNGQQTRLRVQVRVYSPGIKAEAVETRIIHR